LSRKRRKGEFFAQSAKVEVVFLFSSSRKARWIPLFLLFFILNLLTPFNTMFHFSRFDPQVHPGLTEIEDELTQHPNRLYRIGLSDYAFSKEDLESLLEKNCGMVVLQSDQLEAADLDQFIEKGQSSVLIRSKDFEEQALL